MSEIHPFAGSLLTSAQIQQRAAVARAEQVRQKQTLARNAAAAADRLEHEVENVERPPTIGEDDDAERRRPPRKPRGRAVGPEHPDDEAGRTLDVTG